MSGRILVVDDDEATCDLVEALLKRQEFSVAARTSAKSALELVSEDDFDVVLTDVGMSEMSGLGSASASSARGPTCSSSS